MEKIKLHWTYQNIKITITKKLSKFNKINYKNYRKPQFPKEPMKNVLIIDRHAQTICKGCLEVYEFPELKEFTI